MLTEKELMEALEERHGKVLQEKLRKARIGIAGLGGLGSHIAVSLARLGIGSMVLVDYDVVNVSNLNRQHYTMKDLGRYKTEALMDQLMEINPYLDYEIHTQRVTPVNAGNLFSGCFAVCEAFDQADQKAMLIEALLTQEKDMVLVSGNGMAGMDSGNRIVTRQSMKRLYICGDESSDIEEGMGLMAPRVAICAAHQATMVMRLAAGLSEP